MGGLGYTIMEQTILNIWERKAMVIASSEEYSFSLDASYKFPSAAGTECYIDAGFLIDLTEAFGTGNEPSKEWCDENIPYFVGTHTLKINNWVE